MAASNLFFRSLPITASVLGDKLGVKVQVGDEACTDGQTIVIPTMKEGVDLEKEEILGLIVHEAAHLRFTDWSVNAAFRGRGILKAFTNAIEDARIEREIAKDFPGARRLLNAAHAKVIENLCDKYNFVEKPTVGKQRLYESKVIFLVGLYLLTCCALTYHDAYAKLNEVSKKVIDLIFGSDVVQKLTETVAPFKDAQSTKDAFDMALIAEKIIKNHLKAYEDLTYEQTVKLSAQEQQLASAAISAGTSDKQGVSDMDLMSEVKSRMPELKPSSADKLKNCGGKPIKPTDEMLVNAKDAYDCGLMRIARAKALDIPARKALMTLLRTQVNNSWSMARRGRKLLANRLNGLVGGKTDVFGRREQNPGFDSAVTILLDMSGSMGLVTGDKALDATLNLMATMRSIQGIKVSLNIFPTTGIGIPENMSRDNPHWRTDYKSEFKNFFKERKDFCYQAIDFDESLTKAAKRIGCITAYGDTPICQALHQTSLALKNRPEKDKVILVITDGRITDAKKIVDRLTTENGIRVAGLSIDIAMESMAKVIPNCAYAGEAEDIPEALMQLAQKVFARKTA